MKAVCWCLCVPWLPMTMRILPEIFKWHRCALQQRSFTTYTSFAFNSISSGQKATTRDHSVHFCSSDCTMHKYYWQYVKHTHAVHLFHSSNFLFVESRASIWYSLNPIDILTLSIFPFTSTHTHTHSIHAECDIDWKHMQTLCSPSTHTIRTMCALYIVSMF